MYSGIARHFRLWAMDSHRKGCDDAKDEMSICQLLTSQRVVVVLYSCVHVPVPVILQRGGGVSAHEVHDERGNVQKP